MKNIVLTGMPASGKSTTGVLLSKSLGMDFIDTDILIQNSSKMLLQDIISTYGIEQFMKIESETILSLTSTGSVISTGGSAVLDDSSMSHLRRHGTVFYLQLDLDSIITRLHDIKSRGIVMSPGQTIPDIYEIRTPLYQKFSDYTINCNGKSTEQVVNEIIEIID